MRSVLIFTVALFGLSFSRTRNFCEILERKLVCENFNFSDIPENITGRNINEIVLRNNSNLDIQIRNVLRSLSSNLRKLSFRGNTLSSVPKDLFSGFTQLRELDLSENEIHKLENNSFIGLAKLDYLSISNNAISCIEVQSFNPLESLTELDISSNALGSLQCPWLRSICELKQLIVLRLSGNQIGDVLANATEHSSGMFACLTRLTHLECTRSGLTSIHPSTFKGLSYLVNLDLSSNRISFWNDEILNGLASLVYLDLSDNIISSIGKNFLKGLPRISYLSLRNNELKTLDPNWLMDFGNIPRNIQISDYRNVDMAYKWLDISGNSFVCDCEMIPLLQWMNETMKLKWLCSVPGFASIWCQNTTSNRYKKIVSAQSSNNLNIVRQTLDNIKDNCGPSLFSDVKTRPATTAALQEVSVPFTTKLLDTNTTHSFNTRLFPTKMSAMSTGISANPTLFHHTRMATTPTQVSPFHSRQYGAHAIENTTFEVIDVNTISSSGYFPPWLILTMLFADVVVTAVIVILVKHFQFKMHRTYSDLQLRQIQ